MSSVIIAGAGPVGLTAALVLGRKGISVTVLEEGPDLRVVSRASTVHASTLELFDELGVAWDVVAAGRIIRTVQYRDRIQDALIAEFDFETISGDTKFPVRMQTDQTEITRIIHSRLEALPSVSILFNHRVTGARSNDESATVSIQTADGDVLEMSADYVLGADGAHSAVRESLGVKFTGDRYATKYLMVRTNFDFVDHIPGIAPVTYMWGKGVAGSIMELRDHTRVLFHLDPDEDSDHAREPERVQARLAGLMPDLGSPFPVLDSIAYSLYRRVADTFRVGRVFLAGDAAHLNNPSGGMGMNSGIHDAYLFGKTLTALFEGDVNDIALDGYALTRKSVAEGYIHFRSDRNFTNSQSKESDYPQRRRARMSKLASTAESSRDFLLKASMFDTAPRVLW